MTAWNVVRNRGRLALRISLLVALTGCAPAALGDPNRGARDGGARSDTDAASVFDLDAGPLYDCRTAADTDSDTIPDRLEMSRDTDGDGATDDVDTDSDNDGANDVVEAGDHDPCTPPIDSNGDGYPDVLDPDQDDDGLLDGLEASYGTDARDRDSDGDGFVDGVEVLAGTNPASASSRIPERDFYVVLPFEEPAQHKELSFRARLGKADIFFLVDTTGSMFAAIDNVRSSLRSTIVPALDALIADVFMGVGDFRDFPTSPYGDSGDWDFALRTRVVEDVSTVQSALGALRAGGGGDGPEAMTQALYRTAMDSCAGGSGMGAACFRSDAKSIAVVITDAATHNGPSGANPYSGLTARSFDETLSALRAREIRTVGVAVGIELPFVGLLSDATDSLRALASGTSSTGSDGAPLVYPAPGGNVTSSLLDGVAELVGGIEQDVTTARHDDPADSVDATRFLRSVRPKRASGRTRSMDATTFYGVPGGTEVTFDVEFANDFVEPTSSAQVFRATLDVVDDASSLVLDTRNVYVVVPGVGSTILLE